MRLVFIVSALLLALAPAAAADVSVQVDRNRVDDSVGAFVNIRSTVTNTGAEATGKLIAHLNVASLNDVYVDLEDWTAQPTQSLDALGPGESTTVEWDVQAVNAGVFNVYTVVMPNAAGGTLAVSPPVHVEIAGRRTLSAGGALPIALIVPLLLGAAAYGVRRRIHATS